MLVAAGFKDWNPRHFLDTAEMTTALAIGYDWLYDQISPEDRSTIRQAIVKLGLEPGIQVYEKGGWWATGNNNWNQVCNGGMIMGALAIADEETDLFSKTLNSALKSIPSGLTVYPPDGAYPEGPGYWEYGTSYTCVTIQALRSALGIDFGVHESAGLSNTGWYRIHTLGPFGMQFNYADGGAHGRSSSTMFALAQIFHEPRYAAWHTDQLARRHDLKDPVRPSSEDRFFPLNIAWYGSGHTGLRRHVAFGCLLPQSTGCGDFPQRLGRSAGPVPGRRGATIAPITATWISARSFWTPAASAGRLTWEPTTTTWPVTSATSRWTYFRLTNHSHNTLVIDGQLQNTSAKSKVTAFHSSPERSSAVIDMTDAYKGQAVSVRRGLEMLNRQAVYIQDEIAGAVGAVRWALVTEAEVELGGNRAVLRQDGQTLVAQIVEPVAARFEILPTKPPTEKEAQNEGTRLLATTVIPQAEKLTTIRVLLQPSADQQDAPVPAKPLSEWPQ